jgi:Cyanobacterial TRADD-N associated 2-Transmembrane domain
MKIFRKFKVEPAPMLTAEELGSILDDGALLSAGVSIRELRDGVLTSDASEEKAAHFIKSSGAVSRQAAFGRLSTALRRNSKVVSDGLQQARANSQTMFRWMILCIVVGFAAINAGLILVFLGRGGIGLASGIAGLLPEAIAAFFFQKEKELRAYVENCQGQLLNFQRIFSMIDVAETIEASGDRDRIKRDIISAVLGITCHTTSNFDGESVDHPDSREVVVPQTDDSGGTLKETTRRPAQTSAPRPA